MPRQSDAVSPPEPLPPSVASPITIDRRTSHSTLFTWTIRSFSKLANTKSLYSPYFEVDGFDSRLLIYPKGDSLSLPGSLGLYIQLTHPRTYKFNCCAYYKIWISNHLDKSKSICRDSFYRFTCKKKSIGWSEFAISSTVLDPKVGFVIDDSLVIAAYVCVLDESSSFAVDNKCGSSGKFTWNINNIGFFKENLGRHKLISPSFGVEQCNLRVLAYRTVVDDIEYLSIGVDGKDTEKLESFENRSCWCMFRVLVLNQKSGCESIHRDIYGRVGMDSNFGNSKLIGWTDFMEMSRFIGVDDGFVVDDAVVISVSFQAIQESSYCTMIGGCLSGKSSVGEKKSDGYSGKFMWTIKNFTRLKDVLKKRKLTGVSAKSPRFQIGNQDLCLVVYPRGQSQPPSHLSLFLEVTDSDNDSADWSCFLSYRLSVVNKKLDKVIRKQSQTRCSKISKGLGWSEFMTLNYLFDQDAGYLSQDEVTFSAEVSILKDTFVVLNSFMSGFLGLEIDPDLKKDLFMWKMENLSSFKEISDTQEVVSRTFQLADCELQMVVNYGNAGVRATSNSLLISLECNPSITCDPDKIFGVRYRMCLVNCKNPAKRVWKESSFCSKTSKYSVLEFMSISETQESTSRCCGRDGLVFICEILDCCSGSKFTEQEGALLSQDPASSVGFKEVSSNASQVSSRDNEDAIGNLLARAKLVFSTCRDSCSQPRQVTDNILRTADWIRGALHKVFSHIINDESVDGKHLYRAMKRFDWQDTETANTFPSIPLDVWAKIRVLQLETIDLLLDIMVDCCYHHSEASSVEIFSEANSKPSADNDSCLISKLMFHEQNGQTDSTQPLEYENSVKFLPEFGPIQAKKSEELFGVIINSLKSLNDAVPQDCIEPQHRPPSVHKISKILDKAPKHIQKDLINLIPKLVDRSEHLLAASVLLDQLEKPDTEPELQFSIFSAINQLEFDNEFWDQVFSRSSKLLVESHNEQLANTVSFLFMAASRCQHISQTVKILHIRFRRLGADVLPCVRDSLNNALNMYLDLAKAMLRGIDFVSELGDNYLEGLGAPFLFGENGHMSEELNMVDDQLHGELQFWDIYILIELISIPSLTMKASEIFERAVIRGSIVDSSLAMVLERRSAHRLYVASTSFADKKEHGYISGDENTGSSPSEEVEFTAGFGLVERLSLSKDSRVQQFVTRLYVLLTKIFTGEGYHKRILRGPLHRAIRHSNDIQEVAFDSYILVCLIKEEPGFSRLILHEIRKIAKVANADHESILHKLHGSEANLLGCQKEREAERSNMTREKASLLERLSESEGTTKHLKAELSLELDRFAREKKELSKRIQEVERQFKWLQSEKNDETRKLAVETEMFKDRLHNVKVQLSQLGSQYNAELKRVLEDNNALAKKLRSAEAQKTRVDEKLKCCARDTMKQDNIRQSLEDEVCRLKERVGQIEREKGDKEEQIVQYKAHVDQLEAKLTACEQHIHGLEVSIWEEMSQHAPLYGVGLADLSPKELETLARIHEEGLRDIYTIKLQKSTLYR